MKHPSQASVTAPAKPQRPVARRRAGIPALRPIRVRLSLVFVLFLLLVAGVGVFSIDRLASFHSVSAQISGRWLQSNRILGDLNNYISDFRGSEGDLLIASTRADLHAAEQEIARLDDIVEGGEARYSRLEHDPAELALFQQFTQEWATYRQAALRVSALVRSGDMPGAIQLYHGDSRRAFSAANGTLSVLTERNVTGAAEATEREAQAYEEARRLIAGAILISLCLAVAAVAYIVGAVSTPIARLVERMHRISDNDPDVDIPGAQRQDEIGDIARAVVRFRDNTRELERSKAVLAAQTARLEQTLANERRMAELQRNFVSMASHEFRTPLNVIDGHAQRLLRMREPLSAEALAERCGKIRGAVQRMTSLIDRLLDSSQLMDSVAMAAPQSEDFALPQLLHEVCEMHRDSSPSAQLEEAFDAAAAEYVHGDPRLLFQAFSNLVGNAVKYSPARSPVRIAIESRKDALAVSVEDQGIGIPENDVAHLFERYVRGANVAGTVGAGVGLYLVKLVVDLHHGEVAVDSREGHGSRFTVVLPRVAPPRRMP